DPAYTATEDTALTLTPSVLANDFDVDTLPAFTNPPANQTLTAIIDVNTPVTAGTVTPSSTAGNFIFTPSANFNGAVSFAYHVNDGQANSNIITVAINIGATNDAPVAVQDGPYNVAKNGTLSPSTGVLNNDFDVDNDAALNHPLVPQ